ncbi:hypothetical protein NW767_013929 [Fusarium falciforme]|nr:hypothetical protein NW767_013929 [Fusarium falciforme]
MLLKERNNLTSKNREDPPKETSLGTSSTAPTACISEELLASETYWGQLITQTKTPSPIFSRLITAIFVYFDATSAGVLQPSEFCAFMFAAGYSSEQFPPLKISTNDSVSPTDLHELDAWLMSWFQSFPLDHRMATREFPPPPPIEPHNGRIRMRDEILHAFMYPPIPVVPNGLPMLSRLGLEQYFTHLALLDPGDLCVRLNHLLGALPKLMDPETDCPFETQFVPVTCFTLMADLEEGEKRYMIERQQNDARDDIVTKAEEAHDTFDPEQMRHMAISRAMWAAGGGCWVDSNGYKHYSEGL